MLSYRHSYHAGNFADVLKHVVLIEVLLHLVQKEKPFSYIDTHAGAGLYRLDSENANKVQEYKHGIRRLLAEVYPELAEYFALLKGLNNNEILRYPGSPVIAQHFMRPQDYGFLHDLHPSDYRTLSQYFSSDSRFVVKQVDGYKSLLSLLPPQSRRGMVLIDPSYEIKQEYDQVIDTLIQAHKKFATGTYAIWYPVVQRERINQMEQRLVKSGIKNIQKFEVSVQSDSTEHGMTASGMWVINPPWTLLDKMQSILPRLTADLAQGEGSSYVCEILVNE